MAILTAHRVLSGKNVYQGRVLRGSTRIMSSRRRTVYQGRGLHGAARVMSYASDDLPIYAAWPGSVAFLVNLARKTGKFEGTSQRLYDILGVATGAPTDWSSRRVFLISNASTSVVTLDEIGAVLRPSEYIAILGYPKDFMLMPRLRAHQAAGLVTIEAAQPQAK